MKELVLTVSGDIKGMAMNYFLKDESKAKRVRIKLSDDMFNQSMNQSIKLSSSSKHTLNYSKTSSKNLMENEKIIYPALEELNFYNCEINQVKQVEIIIENDSGLTTEYEIYSEKYASN